MVVINCWRMGLEKYGLGTLLSMALLNKFLSNPTIGMVYLFGFWKGKCYVWVYNGTTTSCTLMFSSTYDCLGFMQIILSLSPLETLRLPFFMCSASLTLIFGMVRCIHSLSKLLIYRLPLLLMFVMTSQHLFMSTWHIASCSILSIQASQIALYTSGFVAIG